MTAAEDRWLLSQRDQVAPVMAVGALDGLAGLGLHPLELGPQAAVLLLQLKDAADPPARLSLLEDFLWGLLNCREFRTNH